MIAKFNPGRRGSYCESPFPPEDVTLVEDRSDEIWVRYVLRSDGEENGVEVCSRRDAMAYSCWRVRWYPEQSPAK
jgi:hypothetical protein